MGSSYGEFVKYPRTPHLFGSRGTDDDKHLGRPSHCRFLADVSLIVEEKIDGTNVGIHFTGQGAMVLQCRGHLITEGMHPQYDLFKQWAAVKRPVLERSVGGSVHPVRRVALCPAFGPLPAASALLLRVRHLRQASRRVPEPGTTAGLDRRNGNPDGARAPRRGVGSGETRGLDRSITIRQRVREPAH